MAMESVSRTCADVIEHIGSRTDIPIRRRQDLISAVRRLCRYLHRDARDVPADPDELRRQLAWMSPAASGLSPGSVRNVKSLIGKAMDIAGATTVPRRSRAALTPAWQQLIVAIDDRYQRYRLSHLARYLSERGIDPAGVDDDVVNAYRRDLLSNSLLHRPKQAVRYAVRAWNCVRNTEAGQHLRELQIPISRRQHTLSPAAFRPSFREDLEAYLVHIKGDDLFCERAERPASPDTIISQRHQILALASALVESGHDPQSVRSLAYLVTPEAAKAALTILWTRLGQRKTGYLHNLALLIVHLGRHWVKLPSDELAQLRVLRRRLNPGTLGMAESNRRKLAQFGDPANVSALLGLPKRLMKEAMRRDRGGVRQAILAQAAVAIAILLAAPLRIRTLVGLNADEHILRWRSGPRAVVHLVIPAALIKNRLSLEFVLPPRVVELLDIYWGRFRPRLVTTGILGVPRPARAQASQRDEQANL